MPDLNKRTVKIVLFLVCFCLLGAWIYRMSVFRPAKNFHVVEENKFYRSAQLSGDELEEVVKQYGIKTVINLRGKQEGEWWYDDEAATLARLGVRHENIGFSTEHVQTPENWRQFHEILETAERPILVHCRSGADRTSEASAVYVMDYMGKSRQEALEQVSLKYLHVSLFHPAKRYFIENYEGKEWVLNSYDPCSPKFRKYATGWLKCPPEEKATPASQAN